MANWLQHFSLKTLERAIQGFADEQKLKVGGFGIVYKGTLDSKFGGLIVGMKKTKHMDRSGSQQLLNEVYVLSQINHRNIFQFHGCCFETIKPIFVYKYVPNGNLSEHLQNKKSFVEYLDWVESPNWLGLDVTHVSIVVQRTLGYFNLEYFHKYQLLEKTGVYSFFVVLLELMTFLTALDFNCDPSKVKAH